MTRSYVLALELTKYLNESRFLYLAIFLAIFLAIDRITYIRIYHG